MPTNVYINEVRINVSAIKHLSLLKYRTSGLSTAHKRRIEHELRVQHQCVAFFEGDVLFGIFINVADNQEQKKLLSQFLSVQIRSAQQNPVELTTLAQMPTSSVERFLFTTLSYHASTKGLYRVYGRTLLRPTRDAKKRSHWSIEVTLASEGDHVKMYFTPGFTALVGLEHSYRTERHNLELVNLCRYRSSCSLAATDGSCPYVFPGRLGYYEREVPLASLSSVRQDIFRKDYDRCPEVNGVTKVVMARASRGAKNSLAYPLYVVHARLSGSDLQNDPNIARQLRNATLMSSGKRWGLTNRGLAQVFGQEGKLELGRLQIPIDVLLSTAHPIDGRTITSYRALHISEQPIVIDQQNPHSIRLGWGWLFQSQGAFDREDVHRPFTKVHPYLVVPNEPETQQLVRQLMHVVSDGKYEAKFKGDQLFLGLNQSDSLRKYNSPFVNVWDEEEDVYLVDGSDDDYQRKVLDIKREWNRDPSGSQDPNRIVLIVVPSKDEGDDEVTIYHKMKKVLLEEGIPSQFITVDTLKGLTDESVAFGPILQSLWLNIYAKLGGKPWRLANPLGNVHCFIGIGFGLNPRQVGKHIYAGVAHVFDRYGSWVDIASDSRSLSEPEREDFEGTQKYLQGTSSFKISQNLTQSIVYDALRLYEQYQTKTKQPPKNIILHKLGRIYECEVIGLLEAIKQILGTFSGCKLGILQIEQDHQIRLYGDPQPGNPKVDRVVHRGDGLVVNAHRIVLATTGQVRRGTTTYYPGIGTPTPLLLTSLVPSAELLKQYGCNSSQFYSIEEMARHTMALTQLHWGSTRDLVRLPITALYAQKVADLVSKTQANVSSHMRYHRPWFL